MRENLDAFDAYDWLSRPMIVNPYVFYHQLRSREPVHWNAARRIWVLTRYADVMAALRDRRLSTRWIEAFMNHLPETERRAISRLDRHLSRWMLFSDSPEHTRLRAPVSTAFMPRLVEGLRPRIQGLVNELIDHVQDAGCMDVMRDFAYPLPTMVIAEMLGVPPQDRGRFKAWSEDILAFLATDRPQLDRARQAQRSLLEQTDYLNGIFVQRRKRPQDDEEHIAICVQLLIDGHETTTHLIGNSVLALLQNRDTLEKLQDDPVLITTAVEEFLRYDSPVQFVTRVAVEDFAIDGKQISQGQRVWLMLGAANRDPAQFPHPDRLDIRRRKNQHVAFGNGTHFCLGAPLARLETQIAINTLLSRLPALRFEDETAEPEWLADFKPRGLKTLPILF
jgi:pimeloyl-[acyl-carrier protein] synthase